MIKSVKMLVTRFAVGLLLVVPVAAPAVAYADIGGGLNCGADLKISSADCQAQDTGGQLDQIITLAINLFSVIVGIIAVVMIIVGGLKYITSGGDSGDITSAKNTILYAVVGLIVVAIAQFVVHFVLSKSQSQIGTSVTP